MFFDEKNDSYNTSTGYKASQLERCGQGSTTKFSWSIQCLENGAVIGEIDSASNQICVNNIEHHHHV